MAKLCSIIVLFIVAVFTDLTYSSPWTNPIGNDWITIDSTVYYERKGFAGIGRYVDIECYDSLNCVAMANDGHHGFAWNVTKKTTDGGSTWSVILLDTAWLHFSPRIRIFYPKKDIIVIGCDSGYVVRSTDGGATWNTKRPFNIPPQKAWLWQMFMKGNVAIMQYEAMPEDYISFDYGETWKKIENFGVQFVYGFAGYYSIIDSTTIFASALVEEKKSPTDKTMWTYYFLTTDKGNSWKEITKIPREETKYWKHIFLNRDIGFSRNVITREGSQPGDWDTTTTTIYKAYTGGKSWHKVFEETRLGEGYFDLQVLDENTIMAASFGDCIYSSDGGNNWEKIKKPEFEDINETKYILGFAILTPRSWIVGRGPKLLKYVGKEKSIPEGRIEGDAITISPNPSTDFISIPSLPGERVEIYSQLGVKVLEATTGEENIDVSSLPAGVYFIRSGGIAGKFVKI